MLACPNPCAWKLIEGGVLTTTVGAVGAVTLGVTGEKLKAVGKAGTFTPGGVTFGAFTVGTVAVTLTGEGGTIFIVGELNTIASGWAIATGFFSVIVIAPFTTCLGLIPAFTSNAIIGSWTVLTPTKP